MNSKELYCIRAMIGRLDNPYWSPNHPTMYACNCEGDFGPGAEFSTNLSFRPAWNIYWAIAHKLMTPRQVTRLSIRTMHKEIETAIAVSRISIMVERTRFSLGSLSLLMPHQQFMHLITNEAKQLHTDQAKNLMGKLDPDSLLEMLGKRLVEAKHESA